MYEINNFHLHNLELFQKCMLGKYHFFLLQNLLNFNQSKESVNAFTSLSHNSFNCFSVKVVLLHILITWSKSGGCDLSILFLLSGTQIFCLLRSVLMWLFCGNLIDSCSESLCSISRRYLFLNSLFSSCRWLIVNRVIIYFAIYDIGQLFEPTLLYFFEANYILMINN